MRRLLEVETKFSFDKALVPRFRSNQGTPPFARLRFVRAHSFEDVYYDRERVLSNHGIYIRERTHGESKTLEAKIRVSGSYTRSTFEETTKTEEIRELAKRYVPEAFNGHSREGLDVIARFTTSRHTYEADERFTIVLDETDFGYQLGEVELLVEDAEAAHRDIDAFLSRYAWFFHTSSVMSKLSAFFEYKDKGETR